MAANDKQRWMQTFINGAGQITKVNPKVVVQPSSSNSNSNQESTDIIDESSSGKLRPTETNVKKRKTIQPRFIKPNASGEKILDVCGQIIGKIFFSKDDAPKYTILNEEDGIKYDCRGKLPVIDKGFRYRMKCRLFSFLITRLWK